MWHFGTNVRFAAGFDIEGHFQMIFFLIFLFSVIFSCKRKCMTPVTLSQLHHQLSVTTGYAQPVSHPVMLSANWPSTSQQSWKMLVVSMWGVYVQIRHLWTPAGAATWPFAFLHGFFSSVKISSRISVLHRHISVNDFFPSFILTLFH